MKPYYDDGTCVIYNADADVILDPDSATQTDVVLTDPPYGVGVDYDVWDDSDRGGYWWWMQDRVDLLRALAPLVVFTHRQAALKNLRPDWDWLYCWQKPMCSSSLFFAPILPHWEPIFAYGIKGRDDLPRRFDVFSFSPISGGTHGHPCPKPLSLATALVEAFTLPDQWVLDPFMGSGTTLVAAKSCGRRAIGFEVSERYCEIAAKRLAQEVLPLGGVV